MLPQVSNDPLNTLDSFDVGSGRSGSFYSLPKLEESGVGPVSKLPVSIRIVLESVLRNCDGDRITEQHVRQLANWSATAERSDEIPFVVARIVLQDFTGVPLLVDLAAMRSAVDRMGKDPKVIEPLVPVDLVVDHSVQVDLAGSDQALQRNMEIEFKRNRERYEFLKWGMQAFDGFRVVPSGIGIVHQVNLEYLAQGVLERDGVFFPDSLVGTDSHTTMINGIGIVGWGVGGIEAEAGMLGQPVYFLTPDVVGVELTGALSEGVTATDLVLRVTELLRAEGVVGKFVEFFGAGAESLSVPDRATISNMAPEYGATMGFFPFDDRSVEYMRLTGRDEAHVESVANYFKAQGLYGIPKAGEIEYSSSLSMDLASVRPGVAGPKRPQDRIDLSNLKNRFVELFTTPTEQNGFGKTAAQLNDTFATSVATRNGAAGASGGDQAHEAEESHLPHTSLATESEMVGNRPSADVIGPDDVPNEIEERADVELRHGDVLIAAITSCTNTSNPSVMLAAGLLAKKAVEKGLTVGPAVKTSLAPGSRVVSDYLAQTGLQPYLDKLGFNVVGYGCTTCIGNSGPLDSGLEAAVTGNDVVAASVLSGNRNFEARVHQNIKANFLMSPPLVVAFALAGTIEKDLSSEPLATGPHGDVFLKDIWPTLDEVRECLSTALDPQTFRRLYSGFAEQNPLWNEIPGKTGLVYEWNRDSTYIQEPPFFEDFAMTPAPVEPIAGARPLAILGDSVTTDHISPAGAIKKDSPAGRYLTEHGVETADFNSYGSRRGNDRVMTRGTFANVRIRNLMAPGTEGGVTLHRGAGDGEVGPEEMAIFDAAERYRGEGRPLVVIAGKEYGSGSSRDWAAKGTNLLGVRAVIAQSYERIHRSNLVGMGVLPCVFNDGETAATLGLDGSETFDLLGVEDGVEPRQQLTLRIFRADGKVSETTVTARIDTPIEVEYFRHGGILPYVLRQLVGV
ncbi:MAG: aconitate hydratase [Actinobacteria bacterium]|nr:aconitate hydratase [Actinomycetota bacterium]